MLEFDTPTTGCLIVKRLITGIRHAEHGKDHPAGHIQAAPILNTGLIVTPRRTSAIALLMSRNR